jgi:hypothetical protein
MPIEGKKPAREMVASRPSPGLLVALYDHPEFPLCAGFEFRRPSMEPFRFQTIRNCFAPHATNHGDGGGRTSGYNTAAAMPMRRARREWGI